MPDEPSFCYITTTGRRSGRPHVIEIWFARHDATLYVLAGGRERADWVRNLMADPAVALRLGDDHHHATARVLVSGTDEDGLARRLLLEKYQAPGTADLERWGASALAVAFDLDPGAVRP